MGNFGPTQSGIVEVVVTRWSTDDEREMLLGALLDKGPDALLEELRETRRVGYIRTPNSIGYDLHFAHDHVILVTDRPIGSGRRRTNRARSNIPSR
jgi:hypothetical protein